MIAHSKHKRDLHNTIVIDDGLTITNVNKLTEPDLRTFAGRLAYARQLRRYSQKELAAAAKKAGAPMMSQGAIGNYESGTRSMPRELVPLARALQVSADWLYDGRGQAPGETYPVAAVDRAASAVVAMERTPRAPQAWPFAVEITRFLDLDPAAKADIEAYMRGVIDTCERLVKKTSGN